MLLMISMPVWLFVYWQVQQLIVQHEMEEKLEHAQLQTIRLTATAVQWHKKNKEIVIDGRLFDVKSQSISNGIATFTGLFDDEETVIRQQVNRLMQQQQDKNETGDNDELRESEGNRKHKPIIPYLGRIGDWFGVY